MSSVCHCGRPARGQVPDAGVPATAKYSALTHHFCRQCSQEHCQLAQHQPALIDQDDQEPTLF